MIEESFELLYKIYKLEKLNREMVSHYLREAFVLLNSEFNETDEPTHLLVNVLKLWPDFLGEKGLPFMDFTGTSVELGQIGHPLVVKIKVSHYSYLQGKRHYLMVSLLDKIHDVQFASLSKEEGIDWKIQ